MKSFDEYIKEGIVKKQYIDLRRASSLLNECNKSNVFLKEIVKKIGINDKNANYIIKNAYDIIMELIRAEMLKKGYNSSGQGAHEAEVAYLRVLGFKDAKVRFMDQLRYFRNGILYYGKSFDKEYAKKVISFLDKFYKK